jgi:hypothetical protein
MDGPKNWWKDAFNGYWWKYTGLRQYFVHSIASQTNDSKHNISIHVWCVYFAKHEFGVFTILPNTIYIHNYGYI